MGVGGVEPLSPVRVLLVPVESEDLIRRFAETGSSDVFELRPSCLCIQRDPRF